MALKKKPKMSGKKRARKSPSVKRNPQRRTAKATTPKAAASARKVARKPAVMLTGSVPMPSAADVFCGCADALGPTLARYPDGERDSRSKWITFQLNVLGAVPQFKVIYQMGPQSEWGPNGELPPRAFDLREDADFKNVQFGSLGYADAAKTSYVEFARLKKAGRVPKSARFQVSLPTPFAVICAFMTPRAQAIAEKPYEAQLMRELADICAAIPHDELAIQYDLPMEVAIWEDATDTYFAQPKKGVIDRLARVTDRVPKRVQVGYHLCYGDVSHQHFMDPNDIGVMVDIVNAAVKKTKREIDFVHFPVPRHRTDTAFFAPLKRLKAPGAEVFLGLVHLTDGVAGGKKRIAAAKKFLPHFGVATECGMGRRPVEVMPKLLALHVQIATLV